jgi:hypothetical protein
MLVDLMSEMTTPTDMTKVVSRASAVMLVFYTSVSVVAYAYAGSEVKSPITNQLPTGALLAIVNAALFIHVCVAFFINSSIINKWTLDTVDGYVHCGKSRVAWLVVSLFSLGYAFLISQTAPLFGDIINVMGSTFGMAVGYIIPCCLALKLLPICPGERRVVVVLLAASVAMFAVGGFFSIGLLAQHLRESKTGSESEEGRC